MSRLFPALATLLAVLMPAEAMAQGFVRKEAITDAKLAYNPKPDPLDFELPMPCGGTLALRLVCTAGTGFLDDTRFTGGCGSECQRTDQAYFEGPRPVSVSGSLVAENLPKAWRQKLDASAAELCRAGAGQHPMYYFIGKYEVTRRQWNSVMGEGCPAPKEPLAADDPMPMVGVSWFDAIDFSRRYTQWLLKEHPQTLPFVSANEPAIIRLPTETEWEYAARGGQAVTIDTTKNPLFPMPADSQAQDYGVFRFPGRTRDPELAFVGSKRPTPLGVFDTVGNAAEMVLDTFAFSMAKRRHGASGGFVRKGGSYLTEIDQVMPGRRDEKAFFDRNGPLRQMDLGLRVVLAGLAMPNDPDRASAIDQEWHKIRRSPMQEEGLPSGDLLAQIDTLKKSGANRDEEHDRRLAALRTTIEQNNAELREQRAASIKGLVRSAIFTAETISNYRLRRQLIEINLNETLKEAKAEKRAAAKKKLQENAEKTKKQISVMDDAIRESVSFYIHQVRSVTDGGKEVVDVQVSSMRSDLERQGIIGKILMRRLDTLVLHLERTARGGPLTVEAVIKDIAH